MTLTGSVLYGELKGLELFDPSGDLSFRFFKGHEPLQSSMISANGEWKTAEDVLEMVHCINHCQQFLARDTIVPLRLIQGMTGKQQPALRQGSAARVQRQGRCY